MKTKIDSSKKQMNSKIYINNLPSEEDIEIEINELKCTKIA